MRFKILTLLALICVLLSGCGSNSTSFKDEYNSYHAQEKFNEKADKVKDKVTSEVDNAQNEVQSQDDQIKEEAGKTSSVLEKKGQDEFDNGIKKLDEWSQTGMNASQYAMYVALKGYYFIREISPALIGISIFAGLIFYFISFGNKAKQKFAIFGLMIGIPVILVLLRFVIPWLFTLFGYR